MIGDRVVKTSRSGTRLILIRLRLVMTNESAAASVSALIGAPAESGAKRVISWGASSSRHLLLLGLLARGQAVGVVVIRRRLELGRVAGEAEEDVVEGGPAQTDVLHADLRGVQLADGGHQHRGAAVDGQGQ